MANRRFRSQFMYSNEGMQCVLRAKITFGASGAPTLNYGTGITSIARNSAGTYTITLQDKYNALLRAGHTAVSSTAPTAPSMYVKADNIASAGTMQIVMNSAGTATDPANGEIMLLEIVLRNSTAY